MLTRGVPIRARDANRTQGDDCVAHKWWLVPKIMRRRRKLRIPLSPNILPPATAPIDPHAAQGLEAFDNLPDDIRRFMKRSRRQFKSVAVAEMVNALGEHLTLQRLRKVDRSNDHLR